MITCVVNTLTCLIAGVVTFAVLGNLAESTGQNIEDVVNSGPGLVFITYPEVVLRLPGAWIWAVLFFIMLAVSLNYCNRKRGKIVSLFDRPTDSGH
jgi:solute carrier family 6 (neurotransmitter transporter, GABA) member 1